MISLLRRPRSGLLLFPLALAALAGCQDGTLPTGPAVVGLAFNEVAPASCEGVEIRMTRTASSGPVAAGESGEWTVKLEVSACEDVTEVSAQGGTVGWATTSASTSDGTIGTRKVNKNNEVLFWEIGTLTAGDVATAMLTVNGTVGRKVACGTLISIASGWSVTAAAGAAPVKYDAADPLTVQVCASEPPPPPAAVAPVAANDEYSLTAGQTLTVLAAAGLLANDAVGSPVATITAVLGADGEPLGDRTILLGDVAVDPATGALTLTGATRAGTEWFQYEITNTEGTSRGVITITVTPGVASAMLAHLGDGQTGAVAEALLVAPAVRVTDAYGNPVTATHVAFAVSGGGGSATGLAATTTSDGIAAVGSWTLGAAGVNTLQATSIGLAAVNFTANAVASCTGGTPATAVFSAISSSVPIDDRLIPSGFVNRSVTLLVTDACGTPLSDVAVTWATTTPDAVNGGTTTAADGTATTTWTYWSLCGTHTVSATVAGLDAVTYTLTFAVCRPGGGGRHLS